MSSFNLVVLMGNITRDIEVRYTPTGVAIIKLGLAMNRKWFDSKTNQKKESVVFVDVDVWGKQAETVQQYFKKGDQIHIQGRLDTESWVDKETGKKRTKQKVVCERFQFVGGRKSDGAAPRPAGTTQQRQPTEPGASEPPEDLDIQEESIPF